MGLLRDCGKGRVGQVEDRALVEPRSRRRLTAACCCAVSLCVRVW